MKDSSIPVSWDGGRLHDLDVGARVMWFLEFLPVGLQRFLNPQAGDVFEWCLGGIPPGREEGKDPFKFQGAIQYGVFFLGRRSMAHCYLVSGKCLH